MRILAPINLALFTLVALICMFSAPMDARAQSDNTVVVAVMSDPGHFNPAITTGYNVHVVADSIYNGLVALDEKLMPIPDLALSWDVSKDSKTYTFNLVKNAQWHDGRPFTSADVKFTFENILFKYHSRTRAGLAANVEAIETPDQHTVIFRLKQSYGPLLQRLDVTEAPILPKHVYETGGDANIHAANLKPIGTGPFKFVSYKKGDAVTLKRNGNYFKQGLPKINRLIFRIIPDGSTQLLALEKGDIDYLIHIPNAHVERVKAKGNISLAQTSTGPGGGNCIITLSFNLDRRSLQNVKVRQAFAYAINRQRVVDQILFGWGRIAKAPISSAISWAHNPGSLAKITFDPSKAEALLDSAGLKKSSTGIRLSVDVIHFPRFTKYAEILKQDLSKVGIELKSRVLDRAAAVDAIFMKRKFDTNIISYCNGLDPDIGVKRMYVSSNIGPIPFSNASAYRNSEIDKLFDMAGQTSDTEARTGAYQKIQTILGQELPYWWIVESTFVSGHKKSLTGFRPWTGQFAEYAAFRLNPISDLVK